MDFRSQQTWWTEAWQIAQRHARRGDSDAAADLVQDLAMAALERGQEARQPGAWLERVARNATIDRIRRDQRRQRLLQSSTTEPTLLNDPEMALLAHEQKTLLREAVRTLPTAQRQIAALRFEEDLALGRVAERLGTPPATVRSRLHRTLATLRRELGHLRATFVLGWPAIQTAALSLALAVTTTEVGKPAPATTGAAPTARRTLMAKARGPAPGPAASAIVPSLLAASEPAAAPSSRAARPPAPPTVAVQRMTFDNDAVTGEHESPAGEIIQTSPASRHASLIELRSTLLPELTKSLEDL